MFAPRLACQFVGLAIRDGCEHLVVVASESLQWEEVCNRMGDGATATERILFTRESEIGLPIVFRDTFEGVTLDGDSVFVDVVGE